jgi:hypothetical protein
MRRSLIWLLAGAMLLPPAAPAADTRDRVGVAHAAGRYNFTRDDFLNEGAGRILELGSRVIKVFLVPRSLRDLYPFNSDWPVTDDVVEVAAHPHFQDLFAKPFSTFVLVIGPYHDVAQLLDGIDESEAARERDQMYRLASYLLTAFAGTDKTFVLQNWEGDHMLRAGLPIGVAPSATRLQAMADWLNLRQDAVTQARQEVGERRVTVLHATEVNLLLHAMEGRATLTNDVLPLTHSDLYSYSSWDMDFTPASLVAALDYLAARAPDSGRFGARNVMIGELGLGKTYGFPEEEQRYQRIHRLVDTAVAWGARYVIYWQVYCNEVLRPYQGRPRGMHLQGFWLIPPGALRISLWDDLRTEMRTAVSHAALLIGGRHAVRVGDEGIEARRRDRGDVWQEIAIKDWNGGSLSSGDVVSLQAHDGTYLSVETGSRGRLITRPVATTKGERFVIRLANGKGLIRPGRAFTLQSSRNDRFLGASSRLPGPLSAGRTTPGADEEFRLEELETSVRQP